VSLPSVSFSGLAISAENGLDSATLEPEPFWVKSNWKVDELGKQRIEFPIRLKPSGDIAFGFGEIWALVPWAVRGEQFFILRLGAA
jgi:hypothetical protein